jgi:isopenicillin N synthase-like dioxygenase
VGPNGPPDTIEFINIERDDALSYPAVTHREYPSTVNERMATAVKPFTLKASAVNDTLIEVFNNKLELPEGALAERHKATEVSYSEARTIKRPATEGKQEEIAIGGHTDFGSLSFLVNRLGGLQVLVPGTQDWQYVKVIVRQKYARNSELISSRSHSLVTPFATSEIL